MFPVLAVALAASLGVSGASAGQRAAGADTVVVYKSAT
jgi:hypothetical protein